jgi:uncharacterized membrane protein YhiD involved in acid resistance
MQEAMELFLAAEPIDIIELTVDILLSAIMSGLIYFAFIRFANTLSNRKQFGRIFLVVAVCTTLIIAVIKSSIALSLGLVGALSVIRFRAAIKEPEELAYLFICIATGLGFGAGLRVVTFSAGILILLIIIVRGLLFPKTTDETYNFSVGTEVLSASEIVEILRSFTNRVRIRRLDNSGNKTNSLFVVEFKSVNKLENAIQELKAKDENIVVSFITNETFV